MVFKFVKQMCVAAILGSLLRSAALAAPSDYSGAADLGKLNNFYRAAQLQGNLPGQGLIEIPDYLTDPANDVRYAKKPGFSKEVPFTDSFTINRIMGGVSRSMMVPYKQWNDRLGLESMDYAVCNGTLEKDNQVAADGTYLTDGTCRPASGQPAFVTRPEMLALHLGPYIQAGYQLKDITLMLNQVPWIMAASRGRACTGDNEQGNPPGNREEWKSFIAQFARDLKAAYPGQTPDFKLSGEPSKAWFNGNATQYFALYDDTFHVLRAAFPGSAIMPGEYTGTGYCTSPTGCQSIFDTKDLLNFARENNSVPNYVPRSININLAAPRQETILASYSVPKVVVPAYRRLGPVVAEIHQFGLIGQPFSPSIHTDQGSKQAALEFEWLMELKQQLNPRRVFHWDTVATVRYNGQVYSLLNGSGFVRLFLDRYQGDEMYMLSPKAETSLSPTNDDLVAVGFRGTNRAALMIADFSLDPTKTKPFPVDINLNPQLQKHYTKYIVYNMNDTVFAHLKADLAAAHNLSPAFASCPGCVSDPGAMAINPLAAVKMLADNWPQYRAQLQSNLKWTRFKDSASGQNSQAPQKAVRIGLNPNELMIVESDDPSP